MITDMHLIWSATTKELNSINTTIFLMWRKMFSVSWVCIIRRYDSGLWFYVSFQKTGTAHEAESKEIVPHRPFCIGLKPSAFFFFLIIIDLYYHNQVKLQCGVYHKIKNTCI